jgi:Vitamin K-dependent gamma-carboxylase
MNTAPYSLKASAAALLRGWHEFFHQPCDGRVCAAVRIGYGLLVLIHLAVLHPDLDLWFADRGLLPPDRAREAVSPYAWSLLEWLPGTSTVVHTCYWIAVAHAVAFFVGFFPRINAFLLFVWIVSFQNRNNLINDGEDTLLRMLGFLMIWLPSGRCWSANALIRRWWSARHIPLQPATPSNQCAVPGWGLRLLQLEMAVLFLSAGLSKLSGDAWLNGTALYYVSRLDDHFGRFWVPAWMFDTPWLVAFLTWSVVMIELATPVLIWFRETRRPCLFAVLVFHLANEWTMNLFLFHWLMLCGWMSFLRPEDFAWFARPGFNLHAARAPKPVKTWDATIEQTA